MNNMNVDYVTLHYRSVLNDFSNQFLNEEFSDCILNAEGRSLKVHKAMLCAQSSFLEKMILEHQNIGDLCFIIEGVSFDDLKSVVQFMYHGSAKLYKQNFGSFLVVAELLGVKWLDRIQILSDTEPSSEAVPNVESDQATKPVNMETPQHIAVFKDITNTLDTKGIKRKKHMKSRKHCKRSKCAKEDHRNDCKKHKVNAFRHGENRGKETHLADMDENTFCTALGLKKNEIQPRENSKPDSASKTDVKIFAKSKSVPPLIKINREIKSSVESYETRDSNMFVSEINTVYIEDKNLSFLNIGANELCIRENNIEIECDVLDATSSQFVIDKEPVANIVELREENIIQAEYVDINTERAVLKDEPNDTKEKSSALMLQLDNSDWSSSPEDSNSSTYDGILTPVSYHDASFLQEDNSADEADHSAAAEVNDRTNSPVTGVSDQPVVDVTDKPVADVSDEPVADVSDAPVVDKAVACVSEKPVADVSDEPVADVSDAPVVDKAVACVSEKPVADVSDERVADEPVTGVSDEPVDDISDEPVTDASAALNIDNATNERIPIAVDCDTAVSENDYESEQELPAIDTNADQSPVDDVEPDCEMISENGLDEVNENNVGNTAESSAIVDEEFLTDENNSSQDELDVIPREYGATNGLDYITLSSASPSPLSDEIADPYEPPKHIEIVTLDEKETELDCGVQPLPDLPDLPVELPSQPSPDPIIPSPPRPRIEPLHHSVTTAPLVAKKIHKPIESMSTAPEDVAKQGTVIIRHRGKILRKSSRTKRKRTTQRKDSFQDYLVKTFELKSFVIRLDKYKVGDEPNETEKLDFLSNLNLKKKGVFPLYSEHAYALSAAHKSPRNKRTFKTPQGERSKFRKVDNKSKVIRKKKQQQTELTKFNFTRSINTVEIERLADDVYCREADIREEHNYNFRENERELTSEFSLVV